MGFCKVDRCIKNVAVGQTCCNGCNNVRSKLWMLCRSEMEGRDDTDGPCGRIDQMMLSSPTIFRNKLKSQSHSIHVLQMRNRRKQDVIARLRSMAEKIPNLDEEKLLGDKEEWKK